MATNYTAGRTNFGPLPDPEGRANSLITSALINGLILALILYIGAAAKQAIQRHYELTELIVPSQPQEQPKPKVPPPPKLPDPPKPPEVKLDQPRLALPKPEPKPDIKPIQMEAKLNLPAIREAKPAIILAPQPKAALTAAMPAQNNSVRPSTAPVHLGQTFGVTPNPNATRPATIAAIGNPYGGMNGPAVAPHGVVGSTGIGNGTRPDRTPALTAAWPRPASPAPPAPATAPAFMAMSPRPASPRWPRPRRCSTTSSRSPPPTLKCSPSRPSSTPRSPPAARPGRRGAARHLHRQRPRRRQRHRARPRPRPGRGSPPRRRADPFSPRHTQRTACRHDHQHHHNLPTGVAWKGMKRDRLTSARRSE